MLIFRYASLLMRLSDYSVFCFIPTQMTEKGYAVPHTCHYKSRLSSRALPWIKSGMSSSSTRLQPRSSILMEINKILKCINQDTDYVRVIIKIHVIEMRKKFYARKYCICVWKNIKAIKCLEFEIRTYLYFKIDENLLREFKIFCGFICVIIKKMRI